MSPPPMPPRTEGMFVGRSSSRAHCVLQQSWSSYDKFSECGMARRQSSTAPWFDDDQTSWKRWRRSCEERSFWYSITVLRMILCKCSLKPVYDSMEDGTKRRSKDPKNEEELMDQSCSWKADTEK
mmetsp:Transcript_7784/g.14819  ORF Transcript_7784/g.14819 Transcript_7784/m.14819 type:complete len:125 (-) Transcript_7784:205-579(-)